MSGGITAAMWATAAVAAVGTGYSIYSGEQQADAQERAQNEARKNAQAQASRADEEMNRANAKRPNVAGIMDRNSQMAKGGAAGTMLTGAQGVNQDDLSLGKKTLLGG